jgi:hypothetical protein
MHNEHFGRFVAVLRVETTRRLPCASDIEAMRDADMDMLIRVFRHARSNDRKIFFLSAAWRPRVDKGGCAGTKVAVSDQSFSCEVVDPAGRSCGLLHVAVFLAAGLSRSMASKCTSNARSVQLQLRDYGLFIANAPQIRWT